MPADQALASITIISAEDILKYGFLTLGEAPAAVGAEDFPGLL
jgi:hypothetical protein